MSIYTKTGDQGKTMLQDGVLISKHHPTIQAMAALDEVNAHIGIIKSQLSSTEPSADIEQVQQNIMTIISLISTTSTKKVSYNSHFGAGWKDHFADETKAMETNIDAITAMMPPLKSFVTYGTSPRSAIIDLARAVTRRAETYLSKSAESSDYAHYCFAYINRLSDYLYALARYADFEYAVIQAVNEALHVDVSANDTATTYGTSATSIKAGRGSQNTTALTRHTNSHDDIAHITISKAKALLEAIQQAAQSINLPIAAACTNAAGSPIALHVMDDALPISSEAAIAKAYTAAVVKMPTAKLSTLVQPGQPFYGLEALGGGKLLPIGGGVPIYNAAGLIIGAIGVSGGTAEQDHNLATEISSQHIIIKS